MTWNRVPVLKIPFPEDGFEFEAQASEIRCFSDDSGETWWMIVFLPTSREPVAVPFFLELLAELVPYTPDEEWTPNFRFATWKPPVVP